jgi:DNA-binding PadR family transcriptional regulator
MIWGIVQSRVGMTILTRLKLDTRTYQRELIKQTPYSNKSIIEYLKKMTSAGILNQGKEDVKTKNRRVWVKWYEPTKLGRWLILFLKNPDEIPSDLARKTIEELFELYSSSIVEVCKKYGISLDFFHRILDKQARGVKHHA